MNTAPTRPGMTDIIICVHNAHDDVAACLASLIPACAAQGQCRLILIDDGSEPQTAQLLRRTARDRADVTLIRNETAQGYTRAANQGFAAVQGEIAILLNSDTIMPENGIKKLVACFERGRDIGLVGPLSNAASWQSIPERAAPEGGWAINPLPKGMSVDEMDALVADAARDCDVVARVPLLNGFCIAMRRQVIADLGGFDAQAFPQGFGEEDDFCLRATLAGHGLVLALDCYVHHAKSKSFGSERRKKLTAAGQEALKRLHGTARLEREVATMRDNPYLAQMRRAIAARLAARQGKSTRIRAAG